MTDVEIVSDPNVVVNATVDDAVIIIADSDVSIIVPDLVDVEVISVPEAIISVPEQGPVGPAGPVGPTGPPGPPGAGSGITPSDAVPLVNGIGSPGISALVSRGDHIHPTDTSRSPLASPAFTGNPTAPTPTAGDNDTSLATTAFVMTAVVGAAGATPSGATPLMDGVATAGASALYSRGDHVHPTDTSRAPLASPVFTGNPTAPTPTVGDNDTSLATTAFVNNAVAGIAVPGPSNSNPFVDAIAAPGTSSSYSRGDHVHPTDTSRAPLASPVLTGNPTAPTPSVGDNDTSIATTAFVRAERDFVNVKDYGAVCNGIVDDTAAILAACTSLGVFGGTVIVPNGAKCLIDNNLILPTNVTLRGPHAFVGTPGSNTSVPYDNLGGALIVNSTKSITLLSGSGLSGLLIYRKGMTFSGGGANPAAFAGTAIASSSDDVFIERCMILGFNMGFFSSGGQSIRLEYIFHDNNNGIEISGCYDVVYISNCHAGPFSTIPNGTWAGNLRPGIAYHLHDVVDWAKLTSCFSFGYAHGFLLNNVSSVTLLNCGADDSPPSQFVHTGAYGFYITGASSENRLIGCQSAAHGEDGIVIDTSVGTVTTISDCAVWSVGNHGIVVTSGDVILSNTTFTDMPHGFSVALASSRITDAGGNRFINVTTPWFVTVSTGNVHISDGNDYANLSDGTSVAGSNLQVFTLTSAGTVPLPARGDLFNISGTTTIGNVTGGWAGRTVTFVFISTLTVNNSTGTDHAIRLSGAGPTFVTTPNATLTLRHNGNQWFEIGRSA